MSESEFVQLIRAWINATDWHAQARDVCAQARTAEYDAMMALKRAMETAGIYRLALNGVVYEFDPDDNIYHTIRQNPIIVLDADQAPEEKGS